MGSKTDNEYLAEGEKFGRLVALLHQTMTDIRQHENLLECTSMQVEDVSQKLAVVKDNYHTLELERDKVIQTRTSLQQQRDQIVAEINAQKQQADQLAVFCEALLGIQMCNTQNGFYVMLTNLRENSPSESATLVCNKMTTGKLLQLSVTDCEPQFPMFPELRSKLENNELTLPAFIACCRVLLQES